MGLDAERQHDPRSARDRRLCGVRGLRAGMRPAHRRRPVELRNGEPRERHHQRELGGRRFRCSDRYRLRRAHHAVRHDHRQPTDHTGCMGMVHAVRLAGPGLDHRGPELRPSIRRTVAGWCTPPARSSTVLVPCARSTSPPPRSATTRRPTRPASPGASDPTDRPNTVSGLGPLASNGGPTSTHLPLPGSVLIDSIPADASPCGQSITVDQRGFARPHGESCTARSGRALATAGDQRARRRLSTAVTLAPR